MKSEPHSNEMPERAEDDEQRILREAAHWYILACDHQPLPKDLCRDFANWLRHSPEHIAAFLRVGSFWGRFGIAENIEPTAADDRYLSLSYLREIKRQHLFPKIALVAVAVAALTICLVQRDLHSLGIASASCAVFLLLTCKERVMGYRVAKGFFGDTESETRELIQYMVANAKSIDFTDDSGSPRPCLVPEPSLPPIRAEEVHDGVLSR